MKKWFEQVWNQGNESAIDELMAPNAVVHGLGPDQHGREEFKAFYREYCDAFPDAHFTLDAVISEGDLVAARWTATATHRGDGLGMKATGKPVRLTGMIFIRGVNDRLVEGWNNYDQLGMLQQLGVIPQS